MAEIQKNTKKLSELVDISITFIIMILLLVFMYDKLIKYYISNIYIYIMIISQENYLNKLFSFFFKKPRTLITFLTSTFFTGIKIDQWIKMKNKKN